MQTDCRVGENHALLNENERTLTAAAPSRTCVHCESCAHPHLPSLTWTIPPQVELSIIQHLANRGRLTRTKDVLRQDMVAYYLPIYDVFLAHSHLVSNSYHRRPASPIYDKVTVTIEI
jgi:hypothetical protein